MTEKGKIHPHRPKPSDTAGSRWYRIAVYAILLLSAAVYLPSIDGLALWDDRSLIGAYRSLRQCIDTPFLQHYFRPLVSITFFLEWRAWGRDAFYCHLDNILIHTATTGALIGLLCTLFPNRSSGVPPTVLPHTAIPLLGGLLFAVQPAQISAVAWIGGRTDSLCTLFLTLFLWTLVLSAKGCGARGWSWTALSAILFGLALLTKEQALAVLPLVPAVYFWFGAYNEPRAGIPPVAGPTAIGEGLISSKPSNTSGSCSSLQNHTSDAFVRSLPFLAVSMSFLALWLLHYPDPRVPQSVPPADQALLAGHGAAYYGLLFLAPASRWLHTLTLAQFDRTGWWPAVAGYALLGSLLMLLWRWRKTESVHALLLSYALLAYIPVSNLVPMPSLYAAPYRVGIIGPAIAGLMAAAIYWLWTLLPCTQLRFSRPATVCAAAAFTLWCAYLTVADNATWMSQRTLFGVLHHDDPGNIPTTCQYSRELVAANRAPEAVAILTKMLDELFGNHGWTEPQSSAMQLRTNRNLQRRLRLQYGSSDPIARRLAGVLADLANARWAARDRHGATLALQGARDVDRANPYANLVAARIAFGDKDYRSARASMHISLSAQSERYESHAMMLEILVALKAWAQAEKECDACIEMEPWRPATYRQLAFVMVAQGDRDGAEQALLRSLTDAEGDHIEERRALSEIHNRIASAPIQPQN